MKTQIFSGMLLCMAAAAAVSFSGCKLDNYDPPSSTLTGQVVDRNGNPMGVQGSRGNVSLQLWQPSYPLHADAISINVAQDGSFTALLFDGDYVLRLRSNNGPWVYNAGDSVAINVSGSKNGVQFPVTPYYTISNVSYSVAGNTLTATFTVNEITTGRNIDRIELLLNNTQFVDFDDNVARTQVADDDRTAGQKTLVLDITDAMSNVKNHKLYARVGLKIDGIDQGLYDPQVYVVK